MGRERLSHAQPGMGITRNGIGQGYVTDRVVELLRAEGVEHALVDMGEIRAIGGHPTGGPWCVGLEDPRAPGRIAERIALADKAVATWAATTPCSIRPDDSTTSSSRELAALVGAGI